MRCDWGPQLDEAWRRIAMEGRGVLLYLKQEGRGIGLANKSSEVVDEKRDIVLVAVAGKGFDVRYVFTFDGPDSSESFFHLRPCFRNFWIRVEGELYTVLTRRTRGRHRNVGIEYNLALDEWKANDPRFIQLSQGESAA